MLPHQDLPTMAEAFSRSIVDTATDRWDHTRAVAARAAVAGPALTPEEGDVLRAAAWLHDVGYASGLRQTTFHPVDGARALRDAGWPELVVGLVAHHSGSCFVADVRGLRHALAPFDQPVEGRAGHLADALTWADQTVSSRGEVVTVEERLEEMLRRHGPDSPNARCHAVRAPYVLRAVARTEERIRSSLARARAGTSGTADGPGTARDTGWSL